MYIDIKGIVFYWK